MTSRIAGQNRKRELVNIRIATYNVHRCRGMDRRVIPRRIAEVLRPLQADVIALQEVLGAGPMGHGHDQELGAALGMGWVMGSTRLVRGRLYGNVVMSRSRSASEPAQSLEDFLLVPEIFKSLTKVLDGIGIALDPFGDLPIR